MEEILSSIRRIISDEDAAEETPASPKAAPAPAAAVAQEPEPDPFEEEDFASVTPVPEAQADVLELTKVVNDDGSVTDIEENAPDPDQVFEAEEAEAAPPPLDFPTPPAEPAAPIMGEAAANAAAAALNQLVVEMPKYIGVGQGLTLEEITKELLRPMLKQWLDEHLPATVERLVQEEIARVSRLHR